MTGDSILLEILFLFECAGSLLVRDLLFVVLLIHVLGIILLELVQYVLHILVSQVVLYLLLCSERLLPEFLMLLLVNLFQEGERLI